MGMIKVLFACWMFCAVTMASNSSAYTISKANFQEIKKRYGVLAMHRFEALEKLLNYAVNLSEYEKLVAVNDFFNKVPWMSDQAVWGEEDHWATPLEFLGRNKGDCEDFVIAKYATLKRLGIPDKKLFITYAKSIKYPQGHMILSYYDTPKSIPLILDNTNYEVLPGDKRSDLSPIYSFNAESLFLAKERGLGKRIPGAINKNKKWENFLSRYEKELYEPI
ncbi:transglutaminase-like cysteine peptidase [bacterium]|nr:transglutaminase-like cysteine peptidase [bacterium]MBU1994270.1 transglutaminase-like cysteine peptidase [bacterium]